MNFTTSFNTDIASKVGIIEAIVHDILNKELRFIESLKLSEFYYDNKYWVPISDSTMLLAIMNFQKLDRCIQVLNKKKYLEVRQSESPEKYFIHIPAEMIKQKRQKATTEPASGADYAETESSTVYTFTKFNEDGSSELVHYTEGKVINELLNSFKHINPGYGAFFARQAYRKVLASMLQHYNLDLLFKLLTAVPQTNKMPFAPIITNPVEFERLAPKLLAFINRKKEESKSSFKLEI